MAGIEVLVYDEGHKLKRTDYERDLAVGELTELWISGKRRGTIYDAILYVDDFKVKEETTPGGEKAMIIQLFIE